MAGEKTVAPLTEPVFETQLLNTLILPDPAEVQRSIREMVGSITLFQNRALQRFGRPVQELAESEWRSLLSQRDWQTRVFAALERGDIRVREAALSIWKPLVLLRPAWTMRVVFIDENLRALVALQSMADRLLGIERIGKLAKPIIKERYARLPTEAGDIDIPLFRASGAVVPAEAGAEAVRITEAFQSAAAYSGRLAKTLKNVLRPMRFGDKGYYAEFATMMNQQVGQSALGRRVAAAMLGERLEGRVWTREAVVEWLINDRAGKRVLARLSARTPEQAVDRAWGWVEYYTNRNKAMLRAILNESNTVPAPAVTERLAAEVWKKDGPDLTRAALDEALLRRASPLRRKLDTLFEVLARRPTNYLSRQPLFRATFVRERERLLGLARARLEREGTRLAEEELRNLGVRVDAAARDYALSEVKRVMYSLTERSRFAEAHQFIMPFFAPYQEQLSVWGSLLWDNPHAIAHARLLFRAAKETGTVFQDEETGDWMINVPAFSGVSPMLAMLAGIPGKPLPGGWGVSMRLEGLNLFMQSAITIPTGQFAGDISIPMPGFFYPVQELIEEFVKHGPMPEGVRGVLADWAFQYGPDTSLLPKPWERAINGVQGLFGNRTKMVNDTANNFLDYAAAGGLRIGTPAEVAEGKADYSVKQARFDASKFLIARAILGWILPAAPTIDWPQKDIKDEYFRRIDEQGFDEANAWLKETYPDRPDIIMLGIAHTTWNKDSPAIPSNEIVQAILAVPEFEQASKQFPEFTYMLIPAIAEEAGFDYNAYLLQIAEGSRNSRMPEARVTDLHERQGWDAYYRIQEGFYAEVDRLGAEEGDEAWNALDAQRDADLRELREGNPPWAADYAQVTIFDPDLHRHLRMAREMLAASPLLAQTDVGQGFAEYLAGRDPIADTMKQYDITGLDTAGARLLKLPEQYATLVEEVQARHPRFAPFYDLWFRNDLQRVEVTDRTEYLLDLPRGAPKILAEWRKEWNDRRDRLYNPDNDVDQARAGAAVRQWSLRAEQLGRKYGVNPQEVWWNSMTEAERTRERLQTATTPYVFLSQFDRRTVLGIETDVAVLRVYVGDARLVNAAQQAAAIWNDALGTETVRIVEKPDGAVPIEIQPRPGKFADAEYSEGKIVGNVGGLQDPVTLAHELGHALGLPHAGPGSTDEKFVPWRSIDDTVPAVGLMGTDEGQRQAGPTAGELASVRRTFGLQTEQDWLKAARRRIQLEADLREAELTGEEKGPIYDRYDAYLRSLGKDNPEFARELQRSQDFGYALFQVLPSTWTEGDTAAAEGWRQVQRTMRELNNAMVEKEINSYDDVYARAKIVIEDWIAEWKDYSHKFKAQWEYLDSLADGTLVDVLMPSVFFPIGS